MMPSNSICHEKIKNIYRNQNNFYHKFGLFLPSSFLLKDQFPAIAKPQDCGGYGRGMRRVVEGGGSDQSCENKRATYS